MVLSIYANFMFSTEIVWDEKLEEPADINIIKLYRETEKQNKLKQQTQKN